MPSCSPHEEVLLHVDKVIESIRDLWEEVLHNGYSSLFTGREQPCKERDYVSLQPGEALTEHSGAPHCGHP